MLSRTRWSLAILLVLLAPAAFAADPNRIWDISPYTGYVTGGGIKVNDSQFTNGRNVHVGLARSGMFGVRVETPAGKHRFLSNRFFTKHPFNWEASADYRRSVFDDKQRLFGETPSGPLQVGTSRQLDASILTVHGGALWNLGKPLTSAQREDGAIQPYVAASGGLSYFRTRLPLPADTRPSIAGGGGFRYWITNRLALRFDSRATLMLMSSGRRRTVPMTNRDCPGVCTRTYFYPRTMFQINATIGLTWRARPKATASDRDAAENP